jgi:phage tail tape-measure protein
MKTRTRLTNLRTFTIALAACVGMTLAGGCSDAEQGSLLGAGAGALVGQAIGGNTTGTLIGAGVGAAVGYGVGNESDKRKDTRNYDY